MQSIRSDVLSAASLCRQVFGKMPAWAADLPANWPEAASVKPVGLIPWGIRGWGLRAHAAPARPM